MTLRTWNKSPSLVLVEMGAGFQWLFETALTGPIVLGHWPAWAGSVHHAQGELPGSARKPNLTPSFPRPPGENPTRSWQKQALLRQSLPWCGAGPAALAPTSHLLDHAAAHHGDAFALGLQKESLQSKGTHPGMAAPRTCVGKGSAQHCPVQGHSRDSICSGESGAEGPKGKRRLRKLMQNKGWSWVKLPRGQMATLALCRSPGTNQPEPRCHMAAFASVRVSSLGTASGNAAQLLPKPSWCPPPQAGVQVWHSLPCTGSPAPGSLAGSGTSFPAALLGGGWQSPMGLWGAAAPALLAQHPTQLGQARHGAAGEGTAGPCGVAQGPRGQFPTLPVHLCKVER